MPIPPSPIPVAVLSNLPWIADGPGADPLVRLTATIRLNQAKVRLAAHRIKSPRSLGLNLKHEYEDWYEDILWDLEGYKFYLTALDALTDDDDVEDPEEPEDPTNSDCLIFTDLHRRLLKFWKSFGDERLLVWQRDGQPYLLFGWIEQGIASSEMPGLEISGESPEMAWSNSWRDGLRNWMLLVEGCPVDIRGCPDLAAEPRDDEAVEDRRRELEERLAPLYSPDKVEMTALGDLGYCSAVFGPLECDWLDKHERWVAEEEEQKRQFARDPFNEAFIDISAPGTPELLAEMWRKLRDRHAANLDGQMIMIETARDNKGDPFTHVHLQVKRLRPEEGLSTLSSSVFTSHSWLGRWGYRVVSRTAALLVDHITPEQVLASAQAGTAIPLPIDLDLDLEADAPEWIAALPTLLRTSELNEFDESIRNAMRGFFFSKLPPDQLPEDPEGEH